MHRGTRIMIVPAILALAIGAVASNAEETYSSPWHYKCVGGFCKKEIATGEVNAPVSLAVCQLSCGQYGTLWPRPTGHLSIGTAVRQLDPRKIELAGVDASSPAGKLLERNLESFKRNVQALADGTAKPGGVGLVIHLANVLKVDDVKLTLNTDEKYTLQIVEHANDVRLNATIIAASYFGARHALETLSQLIVFDDLREEIRIARDAYVVDGPVYPYRGVLLDTARNFVDKSTILRTIEAMSMSKMNTFHWHITDSHSFPYASRAWPNMSRYGAYSNRKVYSNEDVKEIVEHGLLRGVRVLPEFDAPAHVGEGWQWVGNNATVCFKAEPWQQYCVEPPCGQLNPASETVYEILEGIYRDMVHDFEPDIFHMGGDEVNINCWNSSEVIRTWMTEKGWDLSEASFYKLWSYFQRKALEKLKEANGGAELPVILWTSGLTSEENLRYLNSSEYIVQIWTTASDHTIGRLLKNNFKIILSNYDALYLDCGFGAWVGTGNNWCSPYKGWQIIYENSPLATIRSQGFADKKNLILGGEVTLWSEQVDSTSVDSRLWPRSAAFAERLWAEPPSSWTHAEQRMLRHRERLVQRGINADSLEPEWCLQNQGHCYL